MKAKAPPAKKVASLDQSRRGPGSWTGTIEAEHWQAWWGTQWVKWPSDIHEQYSLQSARHPATAGSD